MPTLPSWSHGKGMPVFKTETLSRSDTHPHKPFYLAGAVWGPEVAYINGQFVMYYSAEDVQMENLCIGIATSPTAGGPYTPINASRPLLCAVGEPGFINPYPFQDSDGSWYLYWRGPRSSDDETPTINVQAMTPDGMHLTGNATMLLQPDQVWEFHNDTVGVVEAPAVQRCYSNTKYCLFYSGSPCCT